jgi:exopolysaccharide biosynthesis protein
MPRPYQNSLFSLISVSCLLFLGIARADDRAWQPIGQDLEMMRFEVSSYLLFSSSVVLIRSSLKNYQVGVIRAEEFGRTRDSVKSLVQSARAIAGINANFFDDQGEPLGLVVSRGITHHKLHKGGRTLSGVFALTAQGPLITSRESFDPRSAIEAVQAGPRLIERGIALRGFNETSPHKRRAGVCIDSAGRLVLYTVTSSFFGLSLDRLIDILRSAPINCADALNFDGGGSAQLYLNPLRSAEGASAEISIEGHDDVPVVLALFSR